MFNVAGDIRGQARVIERAFGLSDSALAEAVQFIGYRLKLKAA